ncbi:MAG: glycosyltransferase family 4 protein [Wenzhouxiangella sp.]|nr:MAG: glycosyltransferase family 4 protein [Wenzhouxiangella sp.]
MIPANAWVATILALILSAALTPLLRRWLLDRGIVDAPDARRSHLQVTARGGGLAILAAFALTMVLTAGVGREALTLLGFAALLTALGWLDDRHDLPVAIRLAGMFACALGFVFYSGPVQLVEFFHVGINWPWLWTALAVIAVVWLINLHNFMDGSDGLAAMQGAWSAGLLGGMLYLQGLQVPGLAGLALAGACLGFLLWNRPPARLFMGDSGSVLLGGMIGLLALIGAASGAISVWISLIVCALFVVDATATLLHRASAGARWYTPHREHAYQRLMESGWTHGQVLALYFGLNLALSLPTLVLALRHPALEGPLALLLVLALALGWNAVKRNTRQQETINQ